MGLAGAFFTVRKLLSPRARRSWVGRTRAHIELRDMSQSELSLFAVRARSALGERKIGQASASRNGPGGREGLSFCNEERLNPALSRAGHIDPAETTDVTDGHEW